MNQVVVMFNYTQVGSARYTDFQVASNSKRKRKLIPPYTTF